MRACLFCLEIGRESARKLFEITAGTPFQVGYSKNPKRKTALRQIELESFDSGRRLKLGKNQPVLIHYPSTDSSRPCIEVPEHTSIVRRNTRTTASLESTFNRLL